MKTIGLIGGMSWESTIEYYRIINQEVQRRLGGLHSAQLLLYSVDFAEIEALQTSGRWDKAEQAMINAGMRLARGGADFLLICTHTMHRMADLVERETGLPLLHIVDPTAEKIKSAGISRVGLLATRYTMEQAFYKQRLARRFGLEVLIPEDDDRALVHQVIFDELCCGEVKDASRAAYRRIMAQLVAEGAEAIILGCTEIMLLVRPEDCAVPLFDTTTLHANAAVEMALA